MLLEVLLFQCLLSKILIWPKWIKGKFIKICRFERLRITFEWWFKPCLVNDLKGHVRIPSCQTNRVVKIWKAQIMMIEWTKDWTNPSHLTWDWVVGTTRGVINKSYLTEWLSERRDRLNGVSKPSCGLVEMVIQSIRDRMVKVIWMVDI